ncbi:helix-turn-helix transcriptional regulator [Pseudomonas sp. GD03858]|uniref:AraC family transcriptional regulator n=1 Tax=unclassified Pseudomonas TaxID=196821 RepID=UPI00244C5949|nr:MULTISPECIES: helix-turn-helix transcriptional regulator [unclassified Pseudomonas]MDH0648790.1 helix-turn-helix transcriptional regulator [Pseudomonas sp. GD03867]MDH0665211.1 helix-turn-helix transcriptional regulator [Pseudomonas sp. GD03858]
MEAITTEHLAHAWDVDAIPRQVIALSAARVGQDWELAPHRHRKGQLIYTVRGMLDCEVETGVWIVPPQCAVWIPGGMLHSTRGSGETECYCLFVEPEAVEHLPARCCTLSVSPLLRELLLKASGFAPLYAEQGPQGRLIATLLDELCAAPVEDLHLPMPSDRRLRQLTQGLLADPASAAPSGEWARRIGMSERSMSRLLQQEVGMSFGRWRRQLHVILSLQRLTLGESVQAVALGLGYESASGFVTMFRKAMGKPPARYLLERGLDGETQAGRGIVLSGQADGGAPGKPERLAPDASQHLQQ